MFLTSAEHVRQQLAGSGAKRHKEWAALKQQQEQQQKQKLKVCVSCLVLMPHSILSTARSRCLVLLESRRVTHISDFLSLCSLPCQERAKAEAAGRVQAVADRAAKVVQDCDHEQHWPSKRTEAFPPGTFSLTPDALRAVRRAYYKGPSLVLQGSGGAGEEGGRRILREGWEWFGRGCGCGLDNAVTLPNTSSQPWLSSFKVQSVTVTIGGTTRSIALQFNQFMCRTHDSQGSAPLTVAHTHHHLAGRAHHAVASKPIAVAPSSHPTASHRLMWDRGSVAPLIAWQRGVTMQSSSSSKRRHSRSKSVDSLADLVVPLSPTELLERVASELLLCFSLAVRLYSYLGLGLKWLTGFYRLVLYAMLLLPGFIQVRALSPRPVSWSACTPLTAERS